MHITRSGYTVSGESELLRPVPLAWHLRPPERCRGAG